MPDSREPRIDAIDKKLAVVEERLTNSTKLLNETCSKLEAARSAVVTYNVEIKHTQEDIRELRDCISSVKKDIADLKLTAARSGGKWGAITALITAIVSAGGLSLLFKLLT